MAARELFLEHGVENVSTRQIAGRVGISQTALYNYFESKEHLLDQLVASAFRKLEVILCAIEWDEDLSASFSRMASAYIRFGLENPDEYRLAFMLRDGRRAGDVMTLPMRATLGHDAFARLEGHIAQGLEAGTFICHDANANTIAKSTWASMHGLVALLLAYPDFGKDCVDQLISTHVGMLLKGLM